LNVDERLREQLLGYALGALDESEAREVERQLAADAELRGELERVQRSLEPLAESYEEYEPPAGLVAKTCSYVADEAERMEVVLPGRKPSSSDLHPRAKWAAGDWVVLGGICAAAVLLFFPAALNSRFLARVTLCQDNLRQVGTSLAGYSEYIGNGFFPAIPTEGNRAFAGLYAPVLRESGFLSDPRQVRCPEATRDGNALPSFRIPSLAEFDSADPSRILILQRMGGGVYAYNLGVDLNGKLHPVGKLHRPQFAVLADVPETVQGRLVHQNGHNILFEDLHVSFASLGSLPPFVDDPFFNRLGLREAGVDVHDAVVAPSDFPPKRW
jgi:hypothetical protein